MSINQKLNRPHKGGAIKHDLGKPRFSLIPQEAMMALAEIMTYGAEKYEAYNWCKGFSFSKLIDSAYRHLNAIARGEDIDEETGFYHVDLLQANAAMMSENTKHHPQLDDRFVWSKNDKTTTTTFSAKKKVSKKPYRKKTSGRRKNR